MKLTKCILAACLLIPSFALAQTASEAPPTPAQVQAAATPTRDATWWKHAVIYEIYPRSFQDTNGDGVGDLNGITQHMDYLQHLGVDAIWISPMYPSPQVDFGYDISNYEAVDPQYGTMADFDKLLASAKQHNVRVLLDMVLNHTSDKHPWFIESASSRTNPKADWYIWNDGKPDPTNGKGVSAHKGPKGWVVPPNNWSSLFQGSAWEWVPARGQFYYHFFYKQQPDLNWRNPAVEKAMFDTMRFWFDKGVAGFRLDAITTLFEDPTLKDEPLTGKMDASGFPESDHTHTSGLPEVHDVMRKLRQLVDSYPEHRLLVGEIYVPATSDLNAWYGTPSAPELQLPMDTLVGFHQEGGGITGAQNVRLNLDHFRKSMEEMETELDHDQPLLVFDNHDNERSWDRFGDGLHNEQIAKLIASMLLTTRATALMYYGEELGMVTSTPTRREDVKDPIGITGWPKEKGRDGERTPMQWDTANRQAGFSTNPHTWLPVPANYTTVNVATESKQPDSLLNWNEELTRMRRDNPALHDGGFILLEHDNPSVLSYLRTAPKGSPSTIVALNFTDKPATVSFNLGAQGINSPTAKTLLTDDESLKGDQSLSKITLAPYASWIAEVK